MEDLVTRGDTKRMGRKRDRLQVRNKKTSEPMER